MATSSIFANVRITDPKQAEAFINALDAATNNPKPIEKANSNSFITDPEAIRRLMAKRIAK